MSKAKAYSWLQFNYVNPNLFIGIGGTLLILFANLIDIKDANGYAFSMSLALISGAWTIIPSLPILNTAFQLGVGRNTLWRQAVKLNLTISLCTTIAGAILGTIAKINGGRLFSITASFLQTKGQTPLTYWRPDFLILALLGFICVGFFTQAITLWVRRQGKFAGIASLIIIWLTAITAMLLVAIAAFVKLTHPILVSSIAWGGTLIGLTILILITRHAFMHAESTAA